MSATRIAVLIDADNASAAKIDAILKQVATFGNAHDRRAYGNWKSPHLQQWESVLHEYAIAPLQQFALTKGKNASDIAMVIDAMDLLHSGSVDGFAIVSSDADFTPLVMRLRRSGAEVIGFGQAKTPEPFVNACTVFFRVESLGDEESEDTPQTQRMPGTDLRQDTKLVSLLRSAVDNMADDSGWAALGSVGQQIRNQSSFEPRNYGYARLIALIEEIGLFEVDRSEQQIRVRRKQAATTKRAVKKTTSKRTTAQKAQSAEA